MALKELLIKVYVPSDPAADQSAAEDIIEYIKNGVAKLEFVEESSTLEGKNIFDHVKTSAYMPFANALSARINEEDYTLTLTLFDSAGNALDQATVDFPSENALTDISWDGPNKSLVLQYQNKPSKSVSIASIINGLVVDSRTIAGLPLSADISKSALLQALNVADGAKARYADFNDKPQINGNTLEGNKSGAQLGLQNTIPDLEDIRSKATNALPNTTRYGYRLVFVNGRVALKDQTNTNLGEEINLEDVFALKSESGYAISLSINNSNFKMTASLKNKAGSVIATSNEIDLPIESAIVDIDYDEDTKNLIFTLQNGHTTTVPLGAIISGLQTQIDIDHKLNADFVDDSDSLHKFVTQSDIERWNAASEEVESDPIFVSSPAYNITAQNILDWSAKYTKPGTGIPKSDLAEDVQTSLGKADTALQEHQSLENYVQNTRKINNKTLEADITLTASDVGALASNTKYGYDLTVNGTSLTLKDQDGNVLRTVTTQDTDTGATSVVLNSGDQGNAITNLTYNASTRTITFEKSSTFLTQHQDISGKQDVTDNTLATIDKTIVGAINEVNSLAKGRVYTKEYDTIQDMITALNAMNDTTLKAGDNVYIVATGVPDLWVGKIESTSVPYTYVDDETFIEALTGSLATTVQVGYYRLCELETEKVDLSNVVDSNSTITSSGAGNVVTGFSIDSEGNVTLTKGKTAVETSRTIAGVDLVDDITATELKTALDVVTKSGDETITGIKTYKTAGEVSLGRIRFGDVSTYHRELLIGANLQCDYYSDATTKTKTNWADYGTQFQLNEHFLPMANNSFDLGSSSNKWRDIYIAGNLSDGTNAKTIASLITSNNKATVDDYGIVKIAQGRGLDFLGDGRLFVDVAGDVQITNRTVGRPISTERLNFAVVSALTDANHITLTDAQKETAQEVLGIEYGILRLDE